MKSRVVIILSFLFSKSMTDNNNVIYYSISSSDVVISTIANFNRMKKITDDMNLVIKAMKMSPILEVCCP